MTCTLVLTDRHACPLRAPAARDQPMGAKPLHPLIPLKRDRLSNHRQGNPCELLRTTAQHTAPQGDAAGRLAQALVLKSP